jgi:hypothetical protein
MQSHKLLINNFFTASTQGVNSNLDLVNNYFLHTQSLGGGVVNETNVRSFLNNTNNQIIINDFFSYLTGQTSIEEFREIFYSDSKLADIFNTYYQTSILLGVQTPTSVINNEVSDTSAVTTFDTFYNWDGISPTKYINGITLDIINSTRNLTNFTKLESFTSEESYYLPVFIKRDTKQLSRNIFENCPDKVITQLSNINVSQNISNTISAFNLAITPNFSLFSTGSTTGITSGPNTPNVGPMSGDIINSVVQCFVDLNLNTNPTNYWYTYLLNVNLSNVIYSVIEDSSLSIDVFLNSASTLGIEEVDVIIENVTTTNSDFSPFISPIKLSWSAGEQHKQFVVSPITDSLFEVPEKFIVRLDNFVSLIPGPSSAATVNVIDTSLLRFMSISSVGGIISGGTLFFNVNQGQSVTVSVSLNGPSFSGFESADVVINNISTNSSDYAPSGSPINLSWSIGQTTQTFTFSASPTSVLFQGDKAFSIQLQNLSNSSLDSLNFNQANIIIHDPSPDIQFARVNIPSMFVQFGQGNSNSQLRYLSNNSLASFIPDEQNWLLKFGAPAEVGPFNTGPGPNAITGTTQTTYFFGLNNDVRMIITNHGSYPVSFNSQYALPGQSFSATVNSFNFNIDLPSNDGLIPVASLIYSADTLTLAKYDISIQVDFSEINFVLKDLSNSVANNNKFSIGSYALNTFAGPTDIQNGTYKFLTSYSNISAGRETSSSNVLCPVQINDFGLNIENVTIEGIAFLDFNSNTTFSGITLSPNNGGITPDCTLFQFNQPSQTSWTSIAFQSQV